MSNAPAPAPQDEQWLRALRAQINDDELELPLLPNVAAEVLASSVDERADAARLAELIQRDQSLTGHVLRVVNSPAFRGANEIIALQQAIARLGMTRIREIALAASLKGTLLQRGPYEARAAHAWQVSLAAGLWAKEVARVALANVEVAYLCGLLHDVGAPVVLARLGELAPDLDDARVDAVLAAVAPAAGERLAKAWQLPDAVLATIVHLTVPAGAAEHADLVAVAACGAALGEWLCDGELALDCVLGLPALEHLNLYPEDVETLLGRQEAIRTTLESMVL